MSYVLQPYVIDLEALTSAIGSKNQALLQSVIDSDPEAFEEVLGGREIQPQQALSDLVMGLPLDPEQGHAYGNALEKLCAHLGSGLSLKYWDAVRDAALGATGVDKILEESGPPVKLPRAQDGPVIGHIAAGRIAMTMKEMRLRLQNCRDDGVTDLLEEFIGWLDEALAENKGLVLIYD